MTAWDVTGDEIAEWARTGDAHLRLPELVRRLLYATARVRRLSTRSGAGVFLSDWDLLLDAEEAGEYWPAGVSGWELSTRQDVGKALADLEKRAELQSGVASGMGYVAVCARRIRDKQKYFLAPSEPFASRSFLDADDLAAWMSRAPSVGLWFRSLRGDQGFEEIHTLESVLRRWSYATAPPLPERLLLAGAERQDAAAGLRAWAQDSGAKHLAVVADEPHEGALFAAAALALDPIAGEQWSARVAFVTAPAGLAAIDRQQRSTQTIVILDGIFPRETIDPELKVIRAVARTEPAGQPRLSLEPIPSSEMARLLAGIGLAERANTLAREARGRISALRGLLQGTDTPVWASKSEDGEALGTLLLVGGFQSTSSADLAFVGRVLGRDAKEVVSLCERLVRAEGAPVVVDASRRGNVWGFAAPSDAWRLLIRQVPEQLLHRFARETISLLAEHDEQLSADHSLAFFGSHLPASDALVQGVCESLARLAQSDEQLPDYFAFRASAIAASVVRNVLTDAPRARWATLDAQLKTLAEASPNEFLRAVEAGIGAGSDGPAGLLELEIPGLRYPHVGLLWALEALAWEEDTIESIVAILAALCEADTDGDKPGKVVTRPLSTLHTMLDPIVPYTNAEDRAIRRAIDSLRRWPNVAHAFACRAVAYTSPRMLLEPRKPTFLKVSVPSIGEIHSRRAAGASERLADTTALGISVAGRDPKRWADLLTAASDLWEVGEGLARVADKVDDHGQVLWAAIRRHLHARALRAYVSRKNPGSVAKDPKAAAEQHLLESLYAQLTPSDIIVRSEWLFRGRAELPFFADDWQAEQNEVQRLQIETLALIHRELGIDGVVRLILNVGYDLIASAPFALSNFQEELEQALRRKTETILADLYGYMYGCKIRERKVEFPGIAEELAHLAAEGKYPHALAVLRQMDLSDDALDLIDGADPQLRREYWRTARFVPPSSMRKDDERPIRALLDVGNFRVAFELVAYDRVKVGPSILYEVLLEGASNDAKSKEIATLDTLTYWLPIAFERLRGSDVVSPEDLARLAVRYAQRLDDDLKGLPWLTPFVEKNPSIFRRWAEAVDGADPTDDPLELGTEAATRILFAWKGVPYSQLSSPVRDEKLFEWGKTVLNGISTSRSRSRVPTFLAMVLERAVDDDGTWPAMGVRRLLEDLASRTLILDELRLARMNSRGMTVRSLAEGGRQERVLAAGYRETASRLKVDWPSTARMLRDLAESYDDDARKEDRNASTLARQEGFERSLVSGLDVLVALKLASTGVDDLSDRIGWLADELQVPRAEVAVALDVLEQRSFFRGDGTKRLNPLRLRNYLLQDPTPFPLRRASFPEGLGLPTAHSAPVLADEISDGGKPFVMPLAGATLRGKVIEPIHPRAPFAAERDAKLHALLALLDALRLGASKVGTARDVEIARKKLLETL